MKRLLAVVLSIVIMLTLTISVSAAQFVPSITNKGAPNLIVIDQINGKDVVGYITNKDGEKISTEYIDCIIISTITQALNDEDLPEGVKEELLKVYDEFKNGAKLADVCPELADIVKDKWDKDKTPDDLVIKDLFDVTDMCGDITKHLNNDAVLDLTFDLGVNGSTFVTAIVYVDGKWVPVKDCINNGDGTVTVKFTQICPVAFLVPGSGQNMDVVSPITTDTSSVFVWGSVMLVSLVAIVALVIYRRKVNG